MTKTIDKEKLLIFHSGLTNFKETSDKFMLFTINLFPYEATDNEILELSDKLGAYSFLKDDSEDIYSLSDGSPLG
jgi:hypothetical protein